MRSRTKQAGHLLCLFTFICSSCADLNCCQQTIICLKSVFDYFGVLAVNCRFFKTPLCVIYFKLLVLLCGRNIYVFVYFAITHRDSNQGGHRAHGASRKKYYALLRMHICYTYLTKRRHIV